MEKISFAGIENSLSRDEMKKIMAGSGGGGSPYAECEYIYHECIGGNPHFPFTFAWHNYKNYCMHLHNCCAKQAGSTVHTC